MNARQLVKLGVSADAVPAAIIAIQRAATEGIKGRELKERIQQVVAAPESHLQDPNFGEFAQQLIRMPADAPREPITYQTWGTEIDSGAHHQMQQACQLPAAVGAALMPDAHVGYGLPIGGVLALDNAVVPYAVGVDIACRMKLSVLDLPASSLEEQATRLQDSLERGTRFGVGAAHPRGHRPEHAVLDQDWTVTRITRENRDKAWAQLGTSGSGNHFVEYGLLTLDTAQPDLGLEAGSYLALLSHSGSRGTGASVCSTYSAIARARLAKKHAQFAYLAWLDMDSEAGQEYWAAMNLMGDYAAANHDIIHRTVTKLAGARIIAGVENHHNFAWKERHAGREVIVHRKGATPAGAGVLGVIPGSMADPAFIVRGRGQAESLDSAAHGAGRRMSRKAALNKYNFATVRSQLLQRGITVLSAGADEVPGVYKDIHQVMQEQQDLVDVLGRFDPKIVKMAGDGSRAED